MKKNENTRKVLMTVVIIAAAVAAGCRGSTGPAGPAGVPRETVLYVMGWAETDNWLTADTTALVSLLVQNTPALPRVEVNGIRVPYNRFPYPSRWAYYFTSGNFPLFPGDSARLVVTGILLNGSSGIAYASTMLPGHFELTSHDTSVVDTIPLGSGLTVEWAAAYGADVYHVEFSLYYEYVDTLGSYARFECDVDTLLPDRSITFASSQLFPCLAEIDTLLYSGGRLWPSALRSYPVEEGTEGNVQGDGIGFFYGWTYGPYLRLRVGGSTLIAPGEEPRGRRLPKSLERKIRKLGF
ncbi:hypothetical protein AMJ39_07005 [candidate division TA06 bacterium DG_24]|uniref:DUF4249 family protein n=3 Tax=Bacteria division TA06 TaxID=1156500 RepID=A0A0S8JJ28_UNCT6|nr:MAG: hypothetical protein AMJ39_07005 [candidate division TA06 bacterium DG_24]KPK68685.1 MAG: hypothetical protein AMJ82_07590 [candidate division TA06 bacterium SM23_40]KPL09235.1 MAG: hypothetical protein AMJ71_06950 [candidate division TA06 bacterium SM1_40]